MKAARSGHLDPAGKTIIAGHYHTSWGHHIQSGTPEWGEGSDFRIYRDKGIIAIDGCTAYTGKVNVLVIEDDPLEEKK